MNAKKIANNYLNKLKFNKKYDFTLRSCEVCNSKKNSIIQKNISMGNDKFIEFPIVVCEKCGFVFQAIKFTKEFYHDFYSKFYRQNIYKDIKPTDGFVKRQKFRANKLFNFLNSNYTFKKKGAILDIGCSVGEFLRPFLNMGWKCSGNDPDKGFVEYGKKYLKLPIQYEMAEDMKFSHKFDLSLIIGSLEHCYDPNEVLKRIYNHTNKDGLIIISGRGIPRNSKKMYFNHNHHRYLSYNSMDLILMKHGFRPILSTIYPITGDVPERKNEIFCIAVKDQSYKGKLKEFMKYGKIETAKSVKYFFINSENRKSKKYIF